MEKSLGRKLVSLRYSLEIWNQQLSKLKFMSITFLTMQVATRVSSITYIFFFLFLYCFFMQYGVPAFTVPQPDEAMCVLEEKASKLDVSFILLHL